MGKVRRSCQLEINSKEWFQARCREAKKCLLASNPEHLKSNAAKSCSGHIGNIFCYRNGGHIETENANLIKAVFKKIMQGI